MWSKLVKWIKLAQCAYIPVPSLVARYNSALCTWRKSSAVTINHVQICERPSRLFAVTFYCLSEGISEQWMRGLKQVEFSVVAWF